MMENFKGILDRIEYFTPIRYTSGRIVEYDGKAANINALKLTGKIDDTMYNYLNNLPKRDREIYIGKLTRTSRSYYDAIQNGIMKCKTELIRQNHIEPSQIIRIANDAVYINTPYDLKHTSFFDNQFEFRIKSISNVAMYISDEVSIFVSFLQNDQISIDVKGISDDLLQFHQMYMLGFLANLVRSVERSGIDAAIQYYNQFYKDYINLNLPIGFYREFSSSSMYSLKDVDDLWHMSLGVTVLPEGTTVDMIDINYNLNVLRNIWTILLGLYH